MDAKLTFAVVTHAGRFQDEGIPHRFGGFRETLLIRDDFPGRDWNADGTKKCLFLLTVLTDSQDIAGRADRAQI